MYYLADKKRDDFGDFQTPIEAGTAEEASRITGQELEDFFRRGRDLENEIEKKPKKRKK